MDLKTSKKPLSLESKDSLFKTSELPTRDGIELAKGYQITAQYLTEHFDEIGDLLSKFMAYPDLYLDAISAENSPKLFFYQRIFLRAIMRYREVYVVACLKGDTPILSERGMIPIKDFNPTDKVWSDGQWRQVENLNRKEWHGNLVKIQADNCFEEEITTTDDHMFLAVPRSNNSMRPGKFWKNGIDYFGIKGYDDRKEFYRINLREIEPEFVRAKDLTNNDWLLSSIDLYTQDIPYIVAPEAPPRTKNLIKDGIYLNNEFYEWLGIWLAEGSWEKDRISFTISLQEERLKNRIFELSNHVFGLVPKLYQRTDHNSQVIYLDSAHLRVFFEELFGCTYKEINQWNKWIPTSLIHCAPTKQLQLVKGWLDGDGYYRKSGNCYRYKGTTVSNLLCEGIKNILYRNFVNPSITIEERPGKAKVYNINFNGLLAKEFEDAINEGRWVEIKEEMRLGEYYPRVCGDKFYMINKVRKVAILPPDDEDVYCLQMENEVFNVNGVEGHNCRAFSKSFISILAMILQCIFIPGTRRFICAPNKAQGAQIAKEKIIEIYDKWPLIKKEIKGGEIDPTPGNFGKDYVLLTFRNGSTFEVCGALESTRGQRKHGGLIDEIRRSINFVYFH